MHAKFMPTFDYSKSIDMT